MQTAVRSQKEGKVMSLTKVAILSNGRKLELMKKPKSGFSIVYTAAKINSGAIIERSMRIYV